MSPILYSPMALFQYAGLALVFVLLFWIGYAFATGLALQSPPEVLGLGTGFEGFETLPRDQVNAVFEEAREAMFADNQWGNRFKLSGQITSWLSFLATAIITILAGFYGKIVSREQGVTKELLKSLRRKSKKLVSYVGLLAALAAVLTAVSNRTLLEAEQYYDQAEEKGVLITQARANLREAQTPDEAIQILDDLKLKIERR